MPYAGAMEPEALQKAARQKARKAVKKLEALLESEDPKIALDAAKALLDRAYGRTAQTSHDPWLKKQGHVNIDDILKE